MRKIIKHDKCSSRKKVLELRGIEPRASPMRRERDTSTLQSRNDSFKVKLLNQPNVHILMNISKVNSIDRNILTVSRQCLLIYNK